jgi:hypothetical protein
MTTTAPDELRRMNLAEVMRLADTDPTAAQHLALRTRGEHIVRGALAHLGHRYTGTNGWHIGAYATPTRLGFVNIATGVAVETDITLDADVIEATTIPDQEAGPQVSGAVAWTYPDPGEAHRASAPRGWVQLMVDVRDLGGPIEPLATRAHVVAWGLATCYEGRPGKPGYTGLDSFGAGLDWPVTEATTEVRRIAEEALGDIARDLAAHVPEAAAALPDVPAASRAARGAWRRFTYDAAAAAEHALGIGAERELLDDAHVTALNALRDDDYDVIGARTYDLIRVLVQRILTDRLVPAAELLAIHLGPLRTEDGRPTEAWRVLSRQIASLIPSLGEALLSEIASQARRAIDAATAAYTAYGPISVRIPIHPSSTSH